MLMTHSRLEDEFITPALNDLDPALAAESDDEHTENEATSGPDQTVETARPAEG